MELLQNFVFRPDLTDFDADYCVRLQIDPSTPWRCSQRPKIDKMRESKKYNSFKDCSTNLDVSTFSSIINNYWYFTKPRGPPVGFCTAVDADAIHHRRAGSKICFFTSFDADYCVRLQIDPSTPWRWSQGPKIDKMRNSKKCFSDPEG